MSNNKKNLLIISSKSANFGGVEYHCLDLIRCFSNKYNVYIMCPEGPLCSEYSQNGAKVINKTPRSPYDFIFAFYVQKFCKNKKIDIVHCHELISSQGMFGAFLARVPKRIWHVHTPFLFWKNSNFVQDIFKKSVNFVTNFFVANFFSTCVIALTYDIKKHRRFRELVFNKTAVIPNGIDFKKYNTNLSKSDIDTFKKKNNIPLKKTIVGNISRTTSEKGQIFLCEAFNLLNKKYPDKYFLLIAGGGELQHFLNYYCKNNFPNDYFITGKFEETDKNKILKSMNYFVFPSIAEGFGYTPIEAVLSKLPVLVSDIEVLKNVLEESVFYFKSQNVFDLFEKLENMLFMTPKDLEIKVNSGINYLQKYSLENFCRNYENLYEQ